MPLELRGATEAREGRVLTDALLRGEASPAAVEGAAEGAAQGAAAVEATVAAAAAGAATAAADLYGAERAALAASMAALQRQASTRVYRLVSIPSEQRA